MAESLFLLGSDNVLKPMRETSFETEDVFQDLLARFPTLLTDADFGEGSPRRWMLVGREVAVPDVEDGAGRWSLDHLFLDQDGVPTLVEVKRATDTRVRREVVAQMLDYASNASSWWRADELARTFAASCEEQGAEPSFRLNELLGVEAADAEAFWRSVQANLGSGRIRMVFVADRIPRELQRIVEFLNEQMNPASVVALELRPYASGSDQILAPRLIGLTARSSAQKSVTASSAPAPTEEAWMESVQPAWADLVRKFVRFVEANGAVCKVVGRPLAVDVPSTGARIAYVRTNGRVALSGWMLRKTETYKDELTRAALIVQLEELGFSLSSHNPSGDCAFSLPELNQLERWASLEAFFTELIRKLA